MGYGIAACINLDGMVCQCLFDKLIFLFITNNDDVGIEFQGLFNQQFHVVVGREHFDGKKFGIIFDNFQSLLTD